MADQSGTKTIEEVLGDHEPGLTIEEALGSSAPSLSAQQPAGIPLIPPRVTRDRPQPLANPNLVTQKDMDRMLLQGALMGMASIPGGIAGRALLGGLFPGSGAIGAAAGEGLGTTAGGLASGMDPKDAATAGLLAGGLGGAVEGGLGGAARISKAFTSVPTSVFGETAKMAPAQQFDTMLRKPPATAEMNIGRDVLAKLQQARDTLSPGRLTKQSIMKAAESAGVRIPVSDLEQAINGGIADADMASGRANSAASARLRSLKADLARRFPTGDVSPSQADAQLKAFQNDAAMSSTRGNAYLAKTYYGLKDKLRQSFFSAVDKALPGTDIAAATGQAKSYLDSIDTLERFVSDKTPENFVRALYARGEEGAQSARAALRDVESHLGTGGSIEKGIDQLGLKRSWTSEDNQRARTFMGAIEKLFARKVTKGLLVSAQPAGQAAAAATAFGQAMGQKQEGQ